MKFEIFCFVVFTIFSIYFFNASDLQANKCSVSSGGKKIDLSKLTKKNDQYTVVDSSTGYWKFWFNYCALTSTKVCWFSTPAFFTVGDDDEDCYDLGQLSSMKITQLDANNFAKGARVSYKTDNWCGQTSILGIEIDTQCDQSVEWKFVSAEAYAKGTCTMSVVTKSKYACAVADSSGSGSGTGEITPESGGISGGTIFLIILLCLIFVYIVGGMAYNFKIRQIRGIEMIPNLEIWKTIPGLVKDGAVWSFKKTYNFVQSRRGYSQL